MPEPAGYAYVECRALGHSWRHRGKIGVDDPSDKYPRPFGSGTGMIGYISYCGNCKGQRVKWITRSGEVVNRYFPPDGYSLKGEDVYKPTQREWRSTFVASVFEEFTHAR